MSDNKDNTKKGFFSRLFGGSSSSEDTKTKVISTEESAELPSLSALNKMKKADIVSAAKDNDLDLDINLTKAKLLEAWEAHFNLQSSPSAVDDADSDTSGNENRKRVVSPGNALGTGRFSDVGAKIKGSKRKLRKLSVDTHSPPPVEEHPYDRYCEKLVRKYKVDDPLSAVAIHYFGGIWGLLSVAFFAEERYMKQVYAPGSPQVTASGLFFGGE